MAQSDFAEKVEIDGVQIEHTDVMTGDRNQSRFLYYQLKMSMKKAQKIDIIVSFLMESGVRMILKDLKSALDRGAQIEALYALENSRAEGATKGLVQAATGVGKTYLAAFDSEKYERVLFVAHREEILKQAAVSFRNVRKSNDYGFFYGKRKDTDKSVIFASVATLGRSEYLTKDFFAPDYFDYLVIDEAYKGVARFIESIEQECVVLFDEFDKTFKSNKENDEQAKLLSLFDGTADGKKMYIVTCNELYGLNDYIVNRPGRFHYHFRFEYPMATEIREYLEDKLEKKCYGEIDKVIEFAGRINLNYDCLRAIAFELNLGATFEEAIAELNILNVDMEEYDVYLYYETGDVLHRYNYRTNLYEERGFDWISLYSEQGTNVVDVKYEKRHLRYDLEKRALIVPVDYLMLDYGDEDGEEAKVERPDAMGWGRISFGRSYR